MTFLLFLFSIAIFGAARSPEDAHNICLSEPSGGGEGWGGGGATSKIL